MKRILLILALLVSMTAVKAEWTVETVPNPRNTDAQAYVANPDLILTTEDVAKLTKVSQMLYEYSGVELVTVVVDNIGDDLDAFDFSIDLFNLWGIGDKSTNTGVLIFLAVQQRAVEIRTGDGMEGLLPDITCGNILDNYAIPSFLEGEWGEGLVKSAVAIYNRLTTDEARAELLLGYKPQEATESPWKGWSIFSIAVLIIGLLVHVSRAKCPECHTRDTKCKDTVEHRATYTSTGLGTHHYTCRRCGHSWEVPYVIDKLVKSSSSGSGGGWSSGGSRSSGGSFGGGHSSGGGAGRRF